MYIGRNDPCPCGSGIKYKRCCHRDDMILEQLAFETNDVMINEIRLKQTLNVKELQNAPLGLCSVVFLNNNLEMRHYFALAELQKIVGRRGVFTVFAKPIEVSTDFYEEMYDYYFPHFDMRWPHGICDINGKEYDVFRFTIANAYKCLNMLHPKTRCVVDKQDLANAQKYECSGDNVNLESIKLQSTYTKTTYRLFDAFKDAIHRMNADMLSQQTENAQLRAFEAISTSLKAISVRDEALRQVEARDITISELQEENNKLREALTLAKRVPDFDEIENQIEAECKALYVFLEPEAMRSLVEGELIYRTLSVADKCHDSAVAAYGKAVEAQLKKHLQDKKPDAVHDGITLGAIIYAIRDNCIAPYHKSFEVYKNINEKRVAAAHPRALQDKLITKETVEELRRILFEQKVLNNLK